MNLRDNSNIPHSGAHNRHLTIVKIGAEGLSSALDVDSGSRTSSLLGARFFLYRTVAGLYVIRRVVTILSDMNEGIL